MLGLPFLVKFVTQEIKIHIIMANQNPQKSGSSQQQKSDDSRTRWDEQIKKLRSKFPNLTEDDVRYDEKNKEEMYTRLQQKLGKNRKELDEIFSTL